MSGPLGIALAGLAMLVGISNARAASGRFVFSGAVVEPTCLAESGDGDMTPPGAGSVPRRLTCGRTQTDSGRSYSRTLVNLDTVSIANDQLLTYFAGYAVAESGKPARLLEHTYE